MAASYAAIVAHHFISRRAAGGAALILIANALVEMLSSRQARREQVGVSVEGLTI